MKLASRKMIQRLPVLLLKKAQRDASLTTPPEVVDTNDRWSVNRCRFSKGFETESRRLIGWSGRHPQN